MEYKNFKATYEYDPDAKIYHGWVLYMKDVITFQSDDESQMEKEFPLSVDEYLRFCEEVKAKRATKDHNILSHAEMKACMLADAECRKHYFNKILYRTDHYYPVRCRFSSFILCSYVTAKRVS